MSSVSPSSESPLRRPTLSQHNLVLHPSRSSLAIGGSPSRFAPPAPQAHLANPPAVSVSGTNYVASSPSPAASGGTSVFKDARLPNEVREWQTCTLLHELQFRSSAGDLINGCCTPAYREVSDQQTTEAPRELRKTGSSKPIVRPGASDARPLDRSRSMVKQITGNRPIILLLLLLLRRVLEQGKKRRI
ncbi:hypothetical protein NL676_028859 [Syzygium grande]|nr:hypothetical protein NL676_028859 [Syzygium grande]